MTSPQHWRDFIALGDSFTEGMSDERRPDGRHRGWADRVAERLARQDPRFRYANLAVRGKLLDGVVVEQLLPARRLLSDPARTLVSFHAGPNDLLRPGADVDSVSARYERAVRLVSDTGASVLLFTVIPRAGGSGRTADRLAARFERFNRGVRTAAQRHGAFLADQARVEAFADRRLWDDDRLHLAPEGHRRVAALVLDTVGVEAPHDRWWEEPLPPQPRTPRVEALAADLRWVTRHLLPWIGRRIRRVSSGDAVTAKSRRLEPVSVERR
jgi:lysophospholipase L1-like esterase